MGKPRAYNATVEMVDRNIKRGASDKVAFIDDDRSLTYGQLQVRTNRIANILTDLDIRREARIAVLMLDTIDYPVDYPKEIVWDSSSPVLVSTGAGDCFPVWDLTQAR